MERVERQGFFFFFSRGGGFVGEEEEGMKPGSSLRPPLSHVIIDLSRNCGSFLKKSQIRARRAAQEKGAALGSLTRLTPPHPWKGRRDYGGAH